jgi:hypothetical protein
MRAVSVFASLVWPGYTVFPDWFQEGTQGWFTDAFRNFSQVVGFSGIWFDMNEARGKSSLHTSHTTADTDLYLCLCSFLAPAVLLLRRIVRFGPLAFPASEHHPLLHPPRRSWKYGRSWGALALASEA